VHNAQERYLKALGEAIKERGTELLTLAPVTPLCSKTGQKVAKNIQKDLTLEKASRPLPELI